MLGVGNGCRPKDDRPGCEVNRGLRVDRPGSARRGRIVAVVRRGKAILVRQAMPERAQRRTPGPRRWPSGQLEMSAPGVSPQEEPARVRGGDNVEVAVVVDIAEDEGVDAFSEVQQTRPRAMEKPDRDQRSAAVRMNRDGVDAPLAVRMGRGHAGDGNRQQDEECCREEPPGDHVQTIPRLRRRVKMGIGGRESGSGGRGPDRSAPL